MTKTKRVLIVCYYFPPDGGAGTQRAAKFAKYLPASDWSVTVLTRQPPAKRGKWEPEDKTLLQEIGSQTEVIRVAPAEQSQSWAKNLVLADLQPGWMEPAYEALIQRLNKGDIDAVFFTMSPFDLSHLALRLKSQQPNVPVFIDLRDPWALDGWRLVGHYFKWRAHMQQMARTLLMADGVIANTPESKTAFLAAIPGLKPENIAVIPNGYDLEDFTSAATLDSPPPADRMAIVHTGSFHSGYIYQPKSGLVAFLRRLKNYSPEPLIRDARTPLYLLRAVAKLKQEKHPLVEAIQLVFVGPNDPATDRCIAESGVGDKVLCTGYVSHGISVAWLKRADAVFLPLHGLPAGHRSLIVPGKAYEYLASGKPILACLPEGDARDLVTQAQAGFVADPTNVDQIAHALTQVHAAWKSGQLHGAKPGPTIEQYDRRNLTAKLATFMAGQVGTR